MSNPLVATVEHSLEEIGLRDPILLHQKYSPESFGNAEAIFQVGNLVLVFIKDRSYVTVDFADPRDITNILSFDDVSLLMGWESLDEMVNENRSIDFSLPPKGPIPLREALLLIKSNYRELQELFSAAQVEETIVRLEKLSSDRQKALFG